MENGLGMKKHFRARQSNEMRRRPQSLHDHHMTSVLFRFLLSTQCLLLFERFVHKGEQNDMHSDDGCNGSHNVRIGQRGEHLRQGLDHEEDADRDDDDGGGVQGQRDIRTGHFDGGLDTDGECPV